MTERTYAGGLLRGLLVLVVVSSTVAAVPVAGTAADAGVVDVEADDTVTPGERVPIEVALALPEAESLDVTVNVTVEVSVDGERVDRRRVEVSDGGSVAFNVTHQFEPGGTRTVTAAANATFRGQEFTASDSTEVRAVGRVLPRQNAPATDPDGDGRYEDVDGNGEFTVLDVSTLLSILDLIDEQDAALVDFNGDGEVNVLDVTALLEEL